MHGPTLGHGLSRGLRSSLVVLLLVYMGAIFVLSQQAEVQFPAVLSLVPATAVHVAVYAPLGFLLTVASGPSHATGALIGWGSVTFFGITDELHQSLIPGREGSVADVFRDALGAGIGAWLAWLWRAVRRWRVHHGAVGEHAQAGSAR